MLICYKKLRFRLVQILYFFCGVLGVHILANSLVDSFWADVLKSMTQKDIDELVNNLDRYFFSTLLYLYIISFLLFSVLPEKIRRSRWWLRGIYFVLFYFLNILIYMWI